MSSRFASVFVAILWLSVGAPARGENAHEAYKRGLALYAGSFGEAADAFLAAYRQKPKPLILFNVGQASARRAISIKRSSITADSSTRRRRTSERRWQRRRASTCTRSRPSRRSSAAWSTAPIAKRPAR